MELFGEARTEKRKVLDRWNRYYRAFRNRTWSENREKWLPSPSASEVFPSYHTLIAWMTDNTPVMRASPRPDLKKGAVPQQELVSSRGEDMNSVLSSWWTNAGCNPQLQMSLLDMLTYGSGILKTGWDQTLLSGLGEASMRRTDPYNCLPDPFCASFDDARYFIEAHTVPLFEICSRFPDRGRYVKPDGTKMDQRPSDRSGFQVIPMANPGSMGVTGEFPGTATPNIPPRYGYPGFGGTQDYTKTVLLIECWVRTTENYTIPHISGGEYKGNIELERPVWQYVAVANGIILTPETGNPFAHGQLPYVRIPYVEIGEFWSVPLSEHILPAQVALNRLLAAIQTSAELTGNPIFVEDTGSGISRTKLINRAGGRITKNPGTEVRWLDPPEVSANISDMAGFWIDEIDKISGVAAVRGQNLRRREPQGAVDAVQEGAFVRIRAVLRGMEEGLRQAGNQVVSNMVQFYLEPRTVSEVGPRGSENYLLLEPKHFFVPIADPDDETKVTLEPLDFDVWIEAGSTQPLSRSARAAEMDTLFFQGVVDDTAVADAHDVPDRRATLQRTQEKKVAGVLPQEGTNPRRKQ